MKPKEFPGSNIVFGKNQPEYQPLPALVLPDGTVYTCWELTDEEIETIVKNKQIFFKQLTFRERLQPILPLVELGDDITFIED